MPAGASSSRNVSVFCASDFSAACDVAEKAALNLVRRAEQNSLGLTAKLEKRGFSSTVVKEVIERLLDKNLLNDTRFAELWVRSRLSNKKPLTPLWLLSSLAKKGVDRKSSQKALEKVLDPETEYTLLLNYAEKSNISGKGLLKREGFSPGVIDRYYHLL